ncbi:MAG: hypothetical protein V9G19_20135 [Tetrasphaera sp.]
MAEGSNVRVDLDQLVDAVRRVRDVRGVLEGTSPRHDVPAESFGQHDLASAMNRLSDAWQASRASLMMGLDSLADGLDRVRLDFKGTDTALAEAPAGEGHDSAASVGPGQGAGHTSESLIGRWAEEADRLGRLGLPLAALGAGTQAVLAQRRRRAGQVRHSEHVEPTADSGSGSGAADGPGAAAPKAAPDAPSRNGLERALAAGRVLDQLTKPVAGIGPGELS